MRLRRRIRDLEARLVDVETALAGSWPELPPSVSIDMDPGPGIAGSIGSAPVPPYLLDDSDDARSSSRRYL